MACEIDVAKHLECSCIICEVIKNGFNSYEFNRKKKIINAGRPTPALDIIVAGKKCNRKFNNKMYEDVGWLTGCSVLNKIFCWPC